jgi:aminoglycoside phosphotransferase (APT) family kinase protein
MPDADIVIDEPLVRALVAAQAGNLVPNAETVALRHTASGWDNEVWRVGDEWMVRLPRREVAVALVTHEQRWLPELADAVAAASGLALPVPVVRGVPSAIFPRPWSVVRWIDGVSGVATARSTRSGWAPPLARALRALHRPAPRERPHNPFRGGPLRGRDDAVRERLRRLGADGVVSPGDLDAAETAWDAALTAPEWARPDLWLHGDLHAGNLVARGDELVAVIDFGDLTGGDPAYDLAVAWLAFDAPTRGAFRAEYGLDDPPVWVRARGWAAAVALLLSASDDQDPLMHRMVRETLAEIRSDVSR